MGQVPPGGLEGESDPSSEKLEVNAEGLRNESGARTQDKGASCKFPPSMLAFKAAARVGGRGGHTINIR